MERGDLRYASCYCEENVWHLAADPHLPAGERWAVFISNPDRFCPLWAQRASASPGEPVVWDYHVVLLHRGDDRSVQVYDLDTRLTFPIALDAYLAGTFPFAAQLEPRLQPRFRVVEAEDLRRTFASDRSHMWDGERWRAKPPPWPAIAAGDETMNLDRFIDVEAGWVGEVCDLPGLARRFFAAP